MTTALILGGTGFIGGHLARRLKDDGYTWVRVVDRKRPEFGPSAADEVFIADLRNKAPWVYTLDGKPFDEVYQLACEVGGLGYIMDHANDAEMLRNSALINLRALEAVQPFAPKTKIFFSSSACMYPPLDQISAYSSLWTSTKQIACREGDAYPVGEDIGAYAWEKVFSERLYAAYAYHGLVVRIARLHNCFGPYGTWFGGREKAPAAICRKVALAAEGDQVDIWGDGTQARSFMYVDDVVEGIIRLMRSDFQGPVNLGSDEMVTVDQLVDIVCGIAGKTLTKNHIQGPVGVRGRNSDNTLIRQKLDWAPSIPLVKGLEKTYAWIEQQVMADRAAQNSELTAAVS